MSNRTVHVTEKVKLEGFQAILEPGKFGYSLSAVVDSNVIDKLEREVKVLQPAEKAVGKDLDAMDGVNCDV